MKKPPHSYIKQLNKIVDDIYHEACVERDWSWAQLADRADLSPATIHRLGDRITLRPHLLTIWKLAKAVGFELRVEAVAVKVKSIRHLRKAG